MSVLIKGMKKPESCSKCIFKKGTSCGITGTQWEAYTWVLLDFDCNKQTLNDCPLIEAPTSYNEAWDEVIKFISDRINYWDAPCSGDETVRNELASVMWKIAKQMKKVEE